VPITRLLLVRHGESEWNAAGRWQGQADPPLTALGRHQAAIAAGHIADLHRDRPFDHAIASDLDRAFTTASIIAEHLEMASVRPLEALRERHAGPWQGLTRVEIEAQWPGAIKERVWPQGYESDESIIARLLPVLTTIAEQHPGQQLIGIAHGGLLRALDRHIGATEVPVPNLAGRWYDLDNPIRASESIQFVPSDLEFTVE
jgi:broad specificity phosphatase PhoE